MLTLQRASVLAAALALACAQAGAAWAEVTVTPAAKGYDIDVGDGSTANDLLDAIAGATGVSIKGAPADESLSPNHLRGTGLERALRKLLPNADFAVRYGDDDEPSEIIFLTTGNGQDDATPPDPGEGAGDDNADSGTEMNSPPLDGSGF